MSECSVKGLIFNFQRFSLQDGPGIRTTVFLKGCPLRCEWCHNPEGASFQGECCYVASNCIGCGACVSVCPADAHHILSGIGHRFDHSRCIGCGRCAQVCPAKALEWMGRTVTADEIVQEAERDRIFYGEEGGITLSGGEPMAQPEFAIATAALAKKRGLGVCIETSGCCDLKWLLDIQPYVDYFLYDIKHTDEKKLEEYTGASLSHILGNLSQLSSHGARIILRCPMIPERNLEQSHFEGIAKIANGFPGVVRIDLEPYHPLGSEKRQRLGFAEDHCSKKSMTKQEAEEIAAFIRPLVSVPVIVS